jgi:hypothetical protein
LWFDRDCLLVNELRDIAFAKTLTRSAVSGKPPFVFYDLMRNYCEGFGF